MFFLTIHPFLYNPSQVNMQTVEFLQAKEHSCADACLELKTGPTLVLKGYVEINPRKERTNGSGEGQK